MDGSKNEGGYWEKRRLVLLQQMERDEAKLNDKLARTYQTEIAKLDREIASYYQRYGEKNVIEYRKLLTTLSDDDRTLLIERMEEFGKKYPQYAHLLPVRESIYKLNEMEGIQLSMRMQQLEIGAIEQEALQKHLEKQALRSANLAAEQMGFGKSFYTYDASVIKATVGKAWANEQSFSERIWGNRQKLASYLNDDFAKAVARGASYEQVIRELGTRFENVSKRDMRRLVFTEGTYVFNEAHAQTHEQMFDHYTLSTASDKGVCKQCRETEEQTRKEPVPFKDRSPGVNFPPLHPGCRCSYEVAVADWDAWIEKQVAKGGGDSLQGKKKLSRLLQKRDTARFDMGDISDFVQESYGVKLSQRVKEKMNAETVLILFQGFEAALDGWRTAKNYVTSVGSFFSRTAVAQYTYRSGSVELSSVFAAMKPFELEDVLSKAAATGRIHHGATIASMGAHESVHVKLMTAFCEARGYRFPDEDAWDNGRRDEFYDYVDSLLDEAWARYSRTKEGSAFVLKHGKNAMKEARHSISSYALFRSDEALAEGYATVFANGREHNAFATCIFDIVEEIKP